MNIRIAQKRDIDAIMDIYNAAKQFMQATGNGNQWIAGYPSMELIMNSIEKESQYVCVDEEKEIIGTFYFNIENDKTYEKIYDGRWLNDQPYGVIHRLASNGKQKGIADFCFQWCYDQHHNIRVDTHQDNTIMQKIIKKNGYARCGIVHIANGTERIAFQKCGE